MLQYDKGFIMLCDINTEEECLRLNLFGDRTAKIKEMIEIKPGDVGLLYNFDMDQLLGIFRAVGKAKMDIEPKAWKRRFPAQVRVEMVGELQRIKDANCLMKRAGVALGPMATGVMAPMEVVQGKEVMETILANFKGAGE